MKRLIFILLFHANKMPSMFGGHLRNVFYRKKKQLLDKYGTFDGYSLQSIEGKICYSCDGTGYLTWDEDDEESPCMKCMGGYYRLPKLNVLQRVNMMSHIFHLPVDTFRYPMEVEEIQYHITEQIHGYVEHKNGNRFIAWLFWLVFLPKYLLKEKQKEYKFRILMSWPVDKIRKLFKKEVVWKDDSLPF